MTHQVLDAEFVYEPLQLDSREERYNEEKLVVSGWLPSSAFESKKTRLGNLPWLTSLESLPVDRKNFESLVKTVGGILDDDCPVYPTPIGPEGFVVVNEVPLTKAKALAEDQILFECLSPLLEKCKEKEMELVSDYNYCPLEKSRSNQTRENSEDSACAAAEHVNSPNSQTLQWKERYQELIDFQLKYGHCLVPNVWEKNNRLAFWVKRQRYQYKQKKQGHHSTLSDAREQALERLGFVWDSHKAIWEERLNELISFQKTYKHCNVPANYPPNRQLAIWVKCQRRQYRLYCNFQRSNITEERISKLAELGFDWSPRYLRSV